jgi:hypothetical protein
MRRSDGKVYVSKASGSTSSFKCLPDSHSWNADGILMTGITPITARQLIGGGANYQNNNIISDYTPYYSQIVDQYNYTIINGRLAYDNIWSNNYLWSPYRDKLQNNQELPYFGWTTGGSGIYYFNFKIPVRLTKYRLWNSFKAGVINPVSGAEFGNQTPTSWKMQGTNDDVVWEDVDIRTNQTRLPYATSDVASESAYGEFEVENVYENGELIGGTKPYKTFRFIVTSGGRDGYNCNKSGVCTYDWQLGEIQLWGMEDIFSTHALHGYHSSLPFVKYITSAGEPDTSTFKKAFFKSGGLGHDAKNMKTINGIQPYKREWDLYWDIPDGQSQNYLEVGQTAVGYIELDYFIEVISYSLRSGIGVRGGAVTYLAAWELYGSHKDPNYNEWVLMDERSGVTSNSIEINYECSNQGAFKYFKFVAKDGYPRLGCDKSGNCGLWAVRVTDIQLKGNHTGHLWPYPF